MIVWTAFHVKQEPNAWVIEKNCFDHMTGDRRKFINLKK